jgi:membrane protein required for beta-lactamase induction
MLTEKEKKIKEGMKIMGMGSMAFYFSWIFWYMLIGFITAILITLIL